MQKKHSGKMGAIALPVALIAAAVGVLLWMLTGAQGYRAADWTDTDGQRYYRNLVTHQAFAADVDWDGSDGAVIVIPDEVHGDGARRVYRPRCADGICAERAGDMEYPGRLR